MKKNEDIVTLFLALTKLKKMNSRPMKIFIRLLFVCAVFPVASCQVSVSAEQKQENTTQDSVLHVAFLIMDGVYNTELTAPYDIFQHTRFREGITPMEVFTVANTNELVSTFEGLQIKPDKNYLTDDLPHIDILVVPSAEHHLDTDLEDKAMLSFVNQTAEQASFVTSHCDGAFVLAQCGLLDGFVSTTFPSDIELYRQKFPHLEVVENVWFVHDGKYITSAGGARSFEAALYLCEHLYGAEIARSLAKGLVIDWDLEQVPHRIVNAK